MTQALQAGTSPSLQTSEPVFGYQTPTYEYIPEGAIGSYIEVADRWLQAHGVNLLPWQLHVLTGLLSVKDNEMTWAYKSFGLLVARQQGKSELIVAYILLRFFLFNKRDPHKPRTPNQIVYTAQHARSGQDIFQRLASIIKMHDDLNEVVKTKEGKGSEEIIMRDGPNRGDIVKFLTRSPEAGRGTSTSVVIYDEAQDISQVSYRAISRTTTAAHNPVSIYLGTVPNEGVDDLDYFEAIRDAGRKGESKSIAWMEWSPVGSHDPEVEIDPSELEVWKQTNPSLGHFVTLETIQEEWEANQRDIEGFLIERLSYWPARPQFEVGSSNDLDLELWHDNELEEPLELDDKTSWTIALSVGFRGSYSTLYGSVRLPDDSVYVEHLGTYPGKREVIERMKDLRGKLKVRAFVGDAKNLQGIVNDLIEESVKVEAYTNQEVATAFETFEEHFNSGKISHPPANIEFENEVLENAEVYESGGQVKNRYWTSEDKELPLSIIKAMTLAVHAAKDPKLQPKKPGKLQVFKYR